MRLVIVVLVAMFGASLADADPEILVRPNWTKEPAPEAQVAPLRKLENSSHVAGTMWRFENGNLLFIGLEVEAVGATQKLVEQLEQGLIQGIAKGGAGHDVTIGPVTRRTENDRLIIDQVIQGPAAYVHMRRVYAATRDDVVHVAYAQCTSVGASPECDAALDTIRIPIDAVPLENNRTRAISYLIGELVGMGLVIAFVVWLIRKLTRKKAGASLPKQRAV
jgi:hypothetical protein